MEAKLPNVTLNDAEITTILEGLNKELASNKRSQKTTKNPQLQQIWAHHEAITQELIIKLTKLPQEKK
jgi:hypothetical protein